MIHVQFSRIPTGKYFEGKGSRLTTSMHGKIQRGDRSAHGTVMECKNKTKNKKKNSKIQ